jgi:hypothetical protein
MPRGAPTIYTEELIKKAREYADGAWKTEGDAIPMMCGLADYCGCSETQAYKWKKDEGKEEFAEICARVKSLQKRVLINTGLTRKSEASLCKLLLNKHGYSDKKEVDHRSEDGSMSPQPFGFVDCADITQSE